MERDIPTIFKDKIIILKMVVFIVSVFALLFTLSFLPSSKNWLQLAALSMTSRGSFATEPSIAAWEWRSPSSFTEAEILNLLNYSEKKGVDVVFLRIDEYIDIYEMQDTYLKAEAYSKFKNRLNFFVVEATKKNIKVYALAGHPRWATESHRYITDTLTRFSLDFNSMRSAESGLLQGIQFDIEPYALDDYNEETAYAHLFALQETVDRVVRAVENSNQVTSFDVGFAIPYWFDLTDATRPQIEWEGKKQAIFYHMSDRLADLPNSHLAIMTYRTKADGTNGTIFISSEEFSYIESNNYKTKVWIGQEITDVEPKTITFFSLKWAIILREFEKINLSLGGKDEFSGIILNNLKSLQEVYPK